MGIDDAAGDDVLYRIALPGGRWAQLGRIGWEQLSCLQRQWQLLQAGAFGNKAAAHHPGEVPDAGVFDTGGLEADGLEADGLDSVALFDDDDVLRLTLAPVWLICGEQCTAESGCCQLADLDLVLDQLPGDLERSAAATAHLAAIVGCEAHLREALHWLVRSPGDHTDTDRASGMLGPQGGLFTQTCPACVCDPYPHAQMLEGRLSQLSLELSRAAARWQLTVQVERP